MSLFSNAVINFYLNTAEAKTELGHLQDAFTKTADKIQNNFISKLGALALGGGFVKGLTTAYDEILKLSLFAERLSLPTENVSEFVNLFRLLDGTAEDALNVIKRLQVASAQLSVDSSGILKEVSARLGENFFKQDYRGIINGLRKNWDYLSDAAKQNVLQQLGFEDNLAFMRLLKLPENDYRDFLNKSKEIGVIDENTATSVKGLNQALSGLKADFLGNINEKFNAFADAINKVSDTINNFVYGNKETRKEFYDLLMIFGGLVPALRLIGAISKAVFSPTTLLIGALIWGGKHIYENWDKVNESFKKFLEDNPETQKVLDTLAEYIKNPKQAIEDLNKALSDYLKESPNLQIFLDDLSTSVNTLKEALKGLSEYADSSDLIKLLGILEKTANVMYKAAKYYGAFFGAMDVFSRTRNWSQTTDAFKAGISDEQITGGKLKKFNPKYFARPVSSVLNGVPVYSTQQAIFRASLGAPTTNNTLTINGSFYDVDEEQMGAIMGELSKATNGRVSFNKLTIGQQLYAEAGATGRY